MVKYLIDFGASISFVNNNIISIHPVIYWNDLELLKYLISQKLDINRQDKNGHSPLIYAIKRRNISIIQCLIEHGADIQLVNNQIKIIDSIIDHERLDILKYLVTKNLDINSQDEEGQTPLIHAIKRRKLDVMKYLIDYKADIKAVNDKIKVIDSVIDYNKLDILDCLVNKNLNINSQDEVGHTPLIYAIHRGNFNIIKYLIEHGADIQIVNRKIETLKTIIDRGQLNILDYLINKKLDINSKDKEGHTLLAYAIKSRKIEVIKYLIDHGANLRNINQKVKLIKESVIFWNELEILKYLVKHHLNIHQKDENGNTLLHYAIEYKKSNIIDYLKKFENNSIDKQNNECHHQAKKTKI
ncbi:ankyrin [Anaeromyces robustus]|uniref:Ankyrin n=1 Tax=Anaeromyces robustus TaxID=1754192 RepID=A0A1Y1XBE0_9FUNG|nr:ankyrin [Anaeromyces robustus]|eukprot:ORX83059.1 ankyrin [Anaeromyces robustus]